MKYNNLYRSYLGRLWQKVSVDPVTWLHRDGTKLVVSGGQHTHRTGHFWETLGVSGNGHSDLLNVLAANNIDNQGARRS